MTEEKAKQIESAYKFYKSGMKLVGIARILNKPEGTIRRWKHTYKWGNENNEHSPKNTEHSPKNNEHSLLNKNNNLKKDVKQVVDNTKLTDKQQLFCLYYVQCFNAVKAYKKAYGREANNNTFYVYDLLRKKEIKEQINKLKQNKFTRLLLTEDDIFQKYVDIAFSDITDYVDFKGNKLNFCDSSQVDGTLIDEISVGKSGTKIKLLDRLKALEWLSQHMNMATNDQKLKIEYMQEKVGYLKKANEKADDTESFNITIVDADKI